jgi:hypothetical protein
LTIQIDSIKRNVFLKLINENTVQEIIAKTGGTAHYKSPGRSITQVTFAHAGLGQKITYCKSSARGAQFDTPASYKPLRHCEGHSEREMGQNIPLPS